MTIGTAKTGDERRIRPVNHLRVVIPGGEGHLGRLVADRLAGLGHDVTTLTRNPRNTRAGRPGTWKAVVWDGDHLGAWIQTLEGADVLINLTGRSVDCRYNTKNRKEILQSRVRSTFILGEAVRTRRRPPRVWLNSSTATIYRHVYDRQMDEASGEIGGKEPDTPAAWGFSIEVAREWERNLFGSQTPNTRKVALRTAMVMSPAPG